MKRAALRSRGEEATLGVAFELRANVAIRIIVERVDLEPHPALTIDSNAPRRSLWQSIARQALTEGQDSSSTTEEGVELAPRSGNGNGHHARTRRAKRKKQKKTKLATGELACVICDRAFVPSSKRQRTCGRKPCQAELNRQSVRAWTARKKALAQGGA